MCLFISVCVLFKTLVSRVFSVNQTVIYGFKTCNNNLHPADWARTTSHETKGRTWKCLPVLCKQPTCAPNTLGSIQKQNWHRTFTTYRRIYQQSVCAPRQMDSARMCVYINTKSFGFLVYFTARRSTLRSAADRVTSEAARWQVWHETPDSRTVTAAWFVTPSRTVYWPIKIVHLAEELRFHSETFILLATKYFRLWESRDWLAFTVFTFLKRFRRFILKQFSLKLSNQRINFTRINSIQFILYKLLHGL